MRRKSVSARILTMTRMTIGLRQHGSITHTPAVRIRSVTDQGEGSHPRGIAAPDFQASRSRRMPTHTPPGHPLRPLAAITEHRHASHATASGTSAAVLAAIFGTLHPCTCRQRDIRAGARRILCTLHRPQ
jgi:hypothetical protein